MRVLPSVWAFMKEPTQDVEIRGYRIPKGTQIFYSPYVLHQDARWFPEPQRFDPDRFSPEREAQIPKGSKPWDPKAIRPIFGLLFGSL